MDQHEKLNIDVRRHYKLYSVNYKEKWLMDYHWHNTIEISCTIKGKKDQWIDGEYFDEDLLIVNSSALHKMTCDVGRLGFILMIEYDYFKEFCPDLDNVRFNIYKNPQATKRIREILLELYEHYDPEDVWVVRKDHALTYKRLKYDSIETVYIQSKVVEIIYIMMKYLQEKKDPNNKKMEARGQLVKNVMNYIQTHYKEKLSLDTIASEFNYSKAYLSTLFKSYTGITLMQYISNYRLEKSLNYLIKDDESIASISNHVGFNDIKSFNKKFKENYLMTPSENRKKHLASSKELE